IAQLGGRLCRRGLEDASPKPSRTGSQAAPGLAAERHFSGGGGAGRRHANRRGAVGKRGNTVYLEAWPSKHPVLSLSESTGRLSKPVYLPKLANSSTMR